MSQLSKVMRNCMRLLPRRPLPPPSAPKPPLVLHIGPHKTGTTAIQLFCERNRKPLAKAGFWYPKVALAGGQHMILPGCYLSHHPCIPDVLLGGCPEEIVADIAAEVPHGLTPVMSSEVYWELLCSQPDAFTSVLAVLGQRFRVHLVMVERPSCERLWSAIRFNSRLGYAFDPVTDFHVAKNVERVASERLSEVGCPVIRVPYVAADCISPFLESLTSQNIQQRTVRRRHLEALTQRCRSASASLRENISPSAPWFVAFTIEFSQRLLATRGQVVQYDKRVATFLGEVAALGDELELVRRLPDDVVVFQRVDKAKSSGATVLTPTELQAWELICSHPVLQRAAMRAGCIDELRSVARSTRRHRLAA